MKFVYSLVLLGLIVALAGCKPRSGDGGKALTSEFFVGTWETQSLIVSIPTKDNPGKSSKVTLFPFPDSTKTEKPITVLAADGGYRELVVDGTGKTVNTQEGFWHYYQDTLVVRMEPPQADVEFKFGVERKGNRLTMRSMVDWTANGKKTEEMILELKKR